MWQRSISAGRIQYIPLTCLAAALLGASSTESKAAPVFNLTDGNSSVTIDAGSTAGLNSWLVDGQNQAQQQWFWYRIGSSGGEAGINTISSPVSSQTSPGQLTLSYVNPQVGLQLVYSLVGGAPGSASSDLSEQIKISNPGPAPLDFHFFQYVDFNLNGTTAGDSIQLGKNLQNKFNEAFQSEGSSVFAETVTAPGANHAESSVIGVTLASLTDANPTTLNDTTTAGPGNVTWAFEWDLSIASGGSVIISKDLNLIVPEPSAFALVIVGGCGLKFIRRRGANIALQTPKLIRNDSIETTD
jgi:hypothetical protein